jgi:hypothetical protein
MKRPRITIARLMVVVGIIALNAALLRAFFVQEMFSGGILSFFALQAGLFCLLRSRGRVRRFWAGFEVSGTLAVMALFSCEFFPGSALSRLVMSYTDFIVDLVIFRLPFSTSYLLLDAHIDCFLAVVYFIPELFTALLGGLLAADLAGRQESRTASASVATGRGPEPAGDSIG